MKFPKITKGCLLKRYDRDADPLYLAIVTSYKNGICEYTYVWRSKMKHLFVEGAISNKMSKQGMKILFSKNLLYIFPPGELPEIPE